MAKKKPTPPRVVMTGAEVQKNPKYRDFIKETEGNRPPVNDPRASEKTKARLRR